MWSQASERDVQLAFGVIEALQHFAFVYPPAKQVEQREIQQQLRQAFPSIVDNFLLNKFANLPFIFNKVNKGTITLSPRIVNAIFRLLEAVGPRKSVLAALRICMMLDDYPCVANSTVKIMFTYFSALQLAAPDAWDRFSQARDIKLSSSTYYYALKGGARLEIVQLYREAEPELIQMVPRATEIAAQLRSLMLELPDVRTVD